VLFWKGRGFNYYDIRIYRTSELFREKSDSSDFTAKYVSNSRIDLMRIKNVSSTHSGSFGVIWCLLLTRMIRPSSVGVISAIAYPDTFKNSTKFYTNIRSLFCSEIFMRVLLNVRYSKNSKEGIFLRLRNTISQKKKFVNTWFKICACFEKVLVKCLGMKESRFFLECLT